MAPIKKYGVARSIDTSTWYRTLSMILRLATMAEPYEVLQTAECAAQYAYSYYKDKTFPVG